MGKTSWCSFLLSPSRRLLRKTTLNCTPHKTFCAVCYSYTAFKLWWCCLRWEVCILLLWVFTSELYFLKLKFNPGEFLALVAMNGYIYQTQGFFHRKYIAPAVKTIAVGILFSHLLYPKSWFGIVPLAMRNREEMYFWVSPRAVSFGICSWPVVVELTRTWQWRSFLMGLVFGM